jgi:hypothetical protein
MDHGGRHLELVYCERLHVLGIGKHVLGIGNLVYDAR